MKLCGVLCFIFAHYLHFRSMEQSSGRPITSVTVTTDIWTKAEALHARGRARGRSDGRHRTASQYGYVPSVTQAQRHSY